MELSNSFLYFSSSQKMRSVRASGTAAFSLITVFPKFSKSQSMLSFNGASGSSYTFKALGRQTLLATFTGLVPSGKIPFAAIFSSSSVADVAANVWGWLHCLVKAICCSIVGGVGNVLRMAGPSCSRMSGCNRGVNSVLDLLSNSFLIVVRVRSRSLQVEPLSVVWKTLLF